MIWILGISLAIAVSLYLIAPFLAQSIVQTQSEEISTYKAELRALERSEEPEKAKRAILTARLLKAAKSEAPKTGNRSIRLSAFICLGMVGGSVGLYSLIGSPNFTPELRQAAPEMAQTETPDFTTLLPKFEARLAENPDDATGWNLYGRTLMLTGNTSAGLRAYERALELKDTPEIRREYEAAKTFASKVAKGPNADDIAAMQSLSPEDRQAAIKGMVESLRTRLEAEPDDPQGWLRLLRSRKVLGQTEAAKDDIVILREVLPEKADAIIAQSGWDK